MAIKLVIFDIAGTTVEDPNGVGGCLKAALEAAGVEAEQLAINAVMGIPKPMAIRQLMEAAGETPVDRRVLTIFEDFQARMIEYYRSSADVREVEGATDVFRALRKRGIKVALDTGFDRSIVDVLLERLRWDDSVIDASATSDEVGRGRPYPDLVYRLMNSAHITDPKEVAKVGDTPSDLNEGTAAGCGLVIGVTQGTHTREQLSAHPHTHLVETVRDVPALIA